MPQSTAELAQKLWLDPKTRAGPEIGFLSLFGQQ